MKQLFGILCLGFLLASCEQNLVVEKHFSVDPTGWSYQDTLYMSFDINDSITGHNWFFNLRHLEEYPYTNFFAFVETTDPTGNTYIDTLQCNLTDPEGRWLGTRTGSYVDNHILYKYNKRFSTGGTYNCAIVHAMRDTSIAYIENVGISIETQKNQ